MVDPGYTFDEDCSSCCELEPEIVAEEVCPKSLRQCGHHCNHSWTHDICCWCGRSWEEETDGPAN